MDRNFNTNTALTRVLTLLELEVTPCYLERGVRETKLAVFRSHFLNVTPTFHTLNVGGEQIHISSTVRNLGAYFDQTMTLDHHVTNLCWSSCKLATEENQSTEEVP